MEGTVKWFNRIKGYGFIEGEDGQDYFVHYTSVPKGIFLHDGDLVSFEPVEGDKGKQAQDVQLKKKASEINSEDNQTQEEVAEEQPVEAEEVAKEQPVEEEQKEEESVEEQSVEEEKKEE